MESLKEKVQRLIAPKLEMEKLFLVDVEINSNYSIQVYIDSDDSTLTIRQCVRVSRHLEEFLDEDEDVAEKYKLDVSSPGLENSLKIARQYKKIVGKTLKVWTYDEEYFVVQLLAVNEEEIEVKSTTIKDKSLKGRKPKKIVLDETPFKIKLEDIKKAKVHFEI